MHGPLQSSSALALILLRTHAYAYVYITCKEAVYELSLAGSRYYIVAHRF